MDDSESGGEEFTLDDILEAEGDRSSNGDVTNNATSSQTTISSFSAKKTSDPKESSVPFFRVQSSQAMSSKQETFFHKRQVSAPAEMPSEH